MSHERPIIDEILYDEDYMMRYVFCDNHTFVENTKKKVPPLHTIQKVLNGSNQQYSRIVKRNQQGFEESSLENAKILIDDVFPIVFKNLLISTHPKMQNLRMKILETMHYA